MTGKTMFITGAGIGIATALGLSPRARRSARKGAAATASRVIRVGKIVARGTRNLQEESKHVTRIDV